VKGLHAADARRRRHQPRRPPLAKIRPGRPPPAMGPGPGKAWRPPATTADWVTLRGTPAQSLGLSHQLGINFAPTLPPFTFSLFRALALASGTKLCDQTGLFVFVKGAGDLPHHPARQRKDWERGCGRHVCLIPPRRIGLGLRDEPQLGPSIQQHNSRRARSRPWPLQPTHRNDTKHDLPR
jgi:hypothetical protein